MLNARMHYGMTATELVVLVVMVFVVGIFLFLLLAPTSHRHESAKLAMCANNQQQLAVAISAYIQEHDETLPGINWASDIAATSEIFYCPEVMRDSSKGKDFQICYGYNGLLIKDDGTGMKWDSTDKAIDPTIIPLTADVEPVGTLAVPPIMYNTHGRSGAVATPAFRHKGGMTVYSFLDGHIEATKTVLQPRGLSVAPPAGGSGL